MKASASYAASLDLRNPRESADLGLAIVDTMILLWYCRQCDTSVWGLTWTGDALFASFAVRLGLTPFARRLRVKVLPIRVCCACVQQKAECERKIRKGKADEAMMLRAVQELRQRMLEDERQLESASQRIKVLQ